jgi:hypothetical protein
MFNMKKLILFASLVSLLAPASLLAQATNSIPSSHPSIYRSVRALGMGNAFIAMPGTDEGALYYNPAAINDYKKLRFRIVSPVIDFTTASIGLVNDVRDLVNDIDGDSDTSTQINTFETFVDAHTGEFHSINTQIPALMVMHRWFSFGILGDSRTTVSFRNRAFSNFELESRSDIGGVFGTAYGFFEKQLQVGLNVKVLHRISISEVLTSDDVLANSNDFANAIPINRATGVGFDVGLKGKIPTFENSVLEFLAPTAGATWQDVANTRFSGDVPNTEQSISVGVAVHPTFQLGKRDWESHLAIDIREINQSTSLAKKLFLGYELMAPKVLFFRPSFRVGANQVYFAGGVTLDFRILKVEAAYYGEEIGQFTRQGRSNRVAANLSLGF